MRSRTIREGSVGLLILLALGIFAGSILWIRGINLANRSFQVVIEFDKISGMEVGAAVRYRGVTVGRITHIRPGPNSVEVGVELSPANLIIPKEVVVQASQSGLLGESTIDIIPTRDLTAEITAKPLDRNCDRNLIICDNTRLSGQSGVGLDDLIRTSVQFANTYSDPKFLENVKTLIANTSTASLEVTKLGREFTILAKDTRRELKTFGQAANQLGLTAAQVNSLLTVNRANLITVLDNMSQTSAQLRTTISHLNSVLVRADQGELLKNLETLTANAAQASANLRDASQSLNKPENLVLLQQTLDSARATFQNTQKITADLDELTGDPAFRTNLKNLVNGLSGLVSSTQNLQQQAQYARMMAPLEAAAPRSPQPFPPMVSRQIPATPPQASGGKRD